jgi:hypothetical protein
MSPEITVRLCSSTMSADVSSSQASLQHAVAIRAPHRMRVCVERAHFPNAPRDMRWSLSWSVPPHSRTTLAGNPEQIDMCASPCVMDLHAPSHNSIFLDCLSADAPYKPEGDWFIDLSFGPVVTAR